MTHTQQIAQELNIRPAQVQASIDLLDAGNTLPFIARYRKEATDGLDEDQIRRLEEMLKRLRSLDERRETILKSIEEQGQLSDALKQEILKAQNMTELEDLYLPYRPKRRTRASIAAEKGLSGLAELILAQKSSGQSLAQIAQPYLNEAVPTLEDAYAGARDIVAETLNDHAGIRSQTREKALKWGKLQAEKIVEAADEKAVYQTYYEMENRVDRLQAYQILAINRGESEKILRVKVLLDERDWLSIIHRFYRPNPRSPLAEQMELAISDAAKRLLLPAIERDVRSQLSEMAEKHAIQVFASNLKSLLNQPPLSGHVILGLDPAYRTGCKIAIIDMTGKLLTHSTIYPHKPQSQWQEALKSLAQLVKKYQVSLIAIGNGTASRESEQLIAELIHEHHEGPQAVHYLMVNEAGASVYSASPLARAELPELDVSIRGAVSIARRVLDPLAELVKIDPKSIGIGLYQHDVNQKQLSEALDAVVESAVNQVGVEVNTASVALLTHVAGIGPKLAERIIEYRDQSGTFRKRSDLKNVSGLGPKAFEQAAGFLRIRDGDNPLDASAIHPESYHIAKQILKNAGLKSDQAPAERESILNKFRQEQDLRSLAQALNTGLPTLEDIFEQLIRPGRDPREDLPLPILRSDVLSMEALQKGMILNGTVRNVVDFGAFVDIGVKQDGLLHRSQTPRGKSLSVGDIIEVQILDVEIERGRISLAWAKAD